MALVLGGISSLAVAADAPDQTAVFLDVHGRIAERCSLGSVATMAFGDLTVPGLQRVATVGLNCNIPFRIDIRSANGGLANDAYPHGQGSYTGLVPYLMAVAIPVQRPSAGMVIQRFTSTALLAGASLSSEGGIALDDMRLTVALAPPGGAGLLGGTYGETVTITVSPI